MLNCSVAIGQKPGGGNRDFSNMQAEGIITGVVMEKSLDEPMEYANVVSYSMRDSSIVAGTVTDIDGRFKMEEVRYGRFYAIANFIGYNKVYIQDIRITPKQKIVELETIYLETASTNLPTSNSYWSGRHRENAPGCPGCFQCRRAVC